MTLNKAIKRLNQKGTGFVFHIEEMEKNYAPDIFMKGIQTYGYILRNVGDKKSVSAFKLVGDGEPIQFIDFISVDNVEEDYNPQGWGWYSFGELFQKFGGIYLHFGFDDVVHKETEKQYDMYK